MMLAGDELFRGICQGMRGFGTLIFQHSPSPREGREVAKITVFVASGRNSETERL